MGGARKNSSPARRAALALALVPAFAAGPTPVRSLAIAPSFEPVLVQRFAPDCAPADGRSCAHVVLRGLRVRGLTGPAALAVQRQLDRALAGEEGGERTPQELAAAFIDESVTRDRPGAARPWFLERRVRVLSQRSRLVSVEIESVRFAGGAHPATDVRFLNLDPATGEALGLDDLLAPGAAGRLRHVARQALREARIVRTGAASRDADLAAGDDLELPDSIGVTDRALLLSWGAYELAPYARGPLTLEIALPRLAGLLRADGPLGGR